jgi:hypothetical protein
MADDTRDADLETHTKDFLRALNERPDQLLGNQIAEIEKPDPQDVEDIRRYINDLKRVYGQGLQDMYAQRVTWSGHLQVDG